MQYLLLHRLNFRLLFLDSFTHTQMKALRRRLVTLPCIRINPRNRHDTAPICICGVFTISQTPRKQRPRIAVVIHQNTPIVRHRDSFGNGVTDNR